MFTKWLSIFLAVALLLPTTVMLIMSSPSSGTAITQMANDEFLKVELTSPKGKYSVLGKMEFTATITNISFDTVKNIGVETLFGKDIAPLKRNSDIDVTKASLAPGESFQMKYYAKVVGLNGLDNLLLPFYWISSLLQGGKTPTIASFTDGKELLETSVKPAVFSASKADYDASTTVRVWYGGNNSSGVSYVEGVIVEPLKDITYAIQEDDGVYTIALSKNSVTSAFVIGTVFVLPPSDAEPFGIALKVTSISEINGSIIVICIIPELSEVAMSLDFDFEGEPTILWEKAFENYTPPDGTTFEYTSPDGTTYTKGATMEGTNFEYITPARALSVQVQEDIQAQAVVRAQGLVQAQGVIDIDDKRELGSLSLSGKLAEGVTGTVKLSIPEIRTKLYAQTWYVPPVIRIDELIFWIKPEVSVSLAFDLQEKPFEKGIPIGSKIPIALGPTGLYVELGLELKASAKGSVRLGLSISGKQGFDVKRGRDAIYYREAPATVGTLSLNGNLTIGPEQKSSLKWLGINVVESAITAGINISGSKSLVDNPLECTDVSANPFVQIGIKKSLVGDMIGQPSLKWDLPSLGKMHFEKMKKVPSCTAGDDNPSDVFGEYSSTVLDGKTNTPLAGVNVKVIDSTGNVISELTTDKTGKIYFQLPEGQYTIVYSKVGYKASSFSETIVRDEHTKYDAVLLQKREEGDNALEVLVTGNVVEQDTNRPLSGVLVEARKEGSNSVVAMNTTGASGLYALSIEADKDATYNIKFSKAGYAEQIRSNIRFDSSVMVLPNVVMALGSGDGGDDGTFSGFAGGDGTAQKPYQVSTSEQLDKVRNNLSANYILINDIDLAGWDNWVPIGNRDDYPFRGIFDGNKHVIKNMTININGNTAYVYGGLFGLLKGTVRNTGIVNSTIGVTVSNYSYAWAGGIAGRCEDSAFIDNCYNMGRVSAVSSSNPAYAGGIVGQSMSSTISNCYNTGSIDSLSNYGYAFAGGISGNSSSMISNCHNTGKTSATTTGSSNAYAGGIAGEYASSRINSCYNTGKVSATVNSPGSADAFAGGIAGRNNNNQPATISNSYNTGEVGATSSSFYAYAGGIEGRGGASSNISNCFNIGNINATALSATRDAYAGGITGYISNSTMSNCYNIGKVNAKASRATYIGGIEGHGTYFTISNCYYLNNIANAGNGNGTFTNVKALTDSQMKQQSSFVGFDFAKVWTISPSINSGYPYLRGMQP